MPEYSQSTIHIAAPSSRKFSHKGSQWQGAKGTSLSVNTCLTGSAAATMSW